MAYPIHQPFIDLKKNQWNSIIPECVERMYLSRIFLGDNPRTLE